MLSVAMLSGLMAARANPEMPTAPTPGARGRGTGYLFDAAFKRHDTGPGHPERPERLDAIQRAVSASGLMPSLTLIAPRLVEIRWLHEVHTPAYVRLVEASVAAGRRILPTGDTAISAESLHVARLAAGGALAACDAVATGGVVNAFCVVRPPGHHATASRGMGFCVFNNVAVAARYLQIHHGIERVLIVDWDAHHGNGTYDIFKADPSVFQFHLHQEGIYPGTGHVDEIGEGAAAGRTINLPLPRGTTGATLVRLVQERLFPAMATFKPQFILISAGFDGHRDDPIGGWALTADDYAQLTHLICDLADRHSGGRIVSILEGGYDLDALGASVVAHLRALVERANRSPLIAPAADQPGAPQEP